jgi:hypothetical protein
MEPAEECPASNEPITDEVLLAYVDGELAKDAASALEARAAGDNALAAQIALLRGLRRARIRPDPAASDLEVGWSKLSEAIRREGHTSAPWFKQRLAPSWRAAAALAASMVAGVVLGFNVRGAGSPSSTYHMAQSTAAVGYGAQITFAPDVAECEVRAALLAAKAQITSGPSTLGVYELRFANEAERQQGISLLSVRKDLVESLAPVGQVKSQ